MTAVKKRADDGSETSFAILMVVISVIIFLAIYGSEQSD